MPSKYTSNAWKKYAKGEDKDTLKLKDWFRAICRTYGYGCVEEKDFYVNFHEINELDANKEIPFPVDLYISHRKKPEFEVIVEIDGEYHRELEQQLKDAKRDKAIKFRNKDIKILRFDKEALLNGDYTEERLVELLGL